MPLYDADNRLTADACAVVEKDQGNSTIASYTFANLRAERPRDNQVFLDKHPLAQSAKHRNLWAWDGYGLNMSAVDNDSQLRVDSAVTNPRHKIQLAKRVFHASPDLSHGQASPELESRLVGGITTTRKAGGGVICSKQQQQPQQQQQHEIVDRLAEREWDRFDPGVRTVGVANIIPMWVNGGAPSRDIARSEDFLQGMGYAYDGKTWRRQQAAAR
jgi:hypothetical protein